MKIRLGIQFGDMRIENANPSAEWNENMPNT